MYRSHKIDRGSTGFKSRVLSIGANVDAYAIALFVFLFHLWHVSMVARGAIFAKSNLAFDFDINRFVGLWCVSPFPTQENPPEYAVRHPLVVFVRLLCRPLV